MKQDIAGVNNFMRNMVENISLFERGAVGVAVALSLALSVTAILLIFHDENEEEEKNSSNCFSAIHKDPLLTAGPVSVNRLKKEIFVSITIE